MFGLEKLAVMPKSLDEINDIGYVMVRPDGLKLGIEEEIIRRIANKDLIILKRNISVITSEKVDDLYPQIHNRHYYPQLKLALVGQKVMSLAIGGEDNVGNTLLKIKGSVLDTSGSIRGDYSLGHLLSGELLRNFKIGRLSYEQLQSPELELVMREDRMHSDETTAEAINSIKIMFEDHERAELISRYPSLQNIVTIS